MTKEEKEKRKKSVTLTLSYLIEGVLSSIYDIIDKDLIPPTYSDVNIVNACSEYMFNQYKTNPRQYTQSYHRKCLRERNDVLGELYSKGYVIPKVKVKVKKIKVSLKK